MGKTQRRCSNCGYRDCLCFRRIPPKGGILQPEGVSCDCK